MFYEIRDELIEIDYKNIDKDVLTVGMLKSDELANIGEALGFDEDTIEASQRANPMFRTGVDVRDNYTFAELRIVNKDGHEDFVSMFIKKNFFLIVDIIDEDESTVNSFFNSIKKCINHKICEEKIIGNFMESLMSDGSMIAEKLRNELTDMEEAIVHDLVDENFNIDLLGIKKTVLKYYNYYSQIMDITEMLEENDNEVLNEDNLMHISNLSNKVSRLKDDMNSLSSVADHIQDAYASLLDQRLNSTMKIFTIITTIFFPLTIIVGWYGMNFQNMPELVWKYGYLYVIILSILTVIALVILGKRKKWF